MKINATVRIKPSSPVKLTIDTRAVTGRIYVVVENQQDDRAVLRGVGELHDGELVMLEITKEPTLNPGAR